jgi:hypothetical protein
LRTSRLAALAATALAASATATAGSLTAGVSVEGSVIGAAVGVRPELLYQLAGPHHVRFHAGVLSGPEMTFVPIGLGYRARFRRGAVVQPFAGAGWETHHFVIADGPTQHQWFAPYAEAGCGLALDGHTALGVATSVDLALGGEPSPGLELRGFATWTF